MKGWSGVERLDTYFCQAILTDSKWLFEGFSRARGPVFESLHATLEWSRFCAKVAHVQTCRSGNIDSPMWIQLSQSNIRPFQPPLLFYPACVQLRGNPARTLAPQQVGSRAVCLRGYAHISHLSLRNTRSHLLRNE